MSKYRRYLKRRWRQTAKRLCLRFCSLKNLLPSFRRFITGKACSVPRSGTVIKKIQKKFFRLFFKNSWFSRALVALLIFAVIAVNVYWLLNPRAVFGKTYNFTQNDWSGGASTDTANAETNQTGWNKYGSTPAAFNMTGANGSVSVGQKTLTFPESFTTTDYRDAANTNAIFNTISGQLEQGYVRTDITSTISAGQPFGSALDTTNNVLYVTSSAGAACQFVKYDIANNTVVDISAAVLAVETQCTPSGTMQMVYYPATGDIYGVLSKSSVLYYYKIHTANGAVTDLSATIRPAISGATAVSDMKIDTASGTIYLMDQSTNGRFGKYVIGGAATALSANLNTSYSSPSPAISFYNMYYAPVSNTIFFAGSYGFLGKYSGGTYTNLAATMAALGQWTTSNYGYVTGLVCDSAGTAYMLNRNGNGNTYLFSYTAASVAARIPYPTGFGLGITTIIYSASKNALFFGGAVVNVGLSEYLLTNGQFINITSESFSSNFFPVTCDTTGSQLLFWGTSGVSSPWIKYSYGPTTSAVSTTIATAALSATLTKNDTPGTGSVVYQLSSNGGATWTTVTPGTPLVFPSPSSLKYKIIVNGNATVQDIAVVYTTYYDYGFFYSSKFDSGDNANALKQLSWDEGTTPSNSTEVDVTLYSAATAAGLDSGATVHTFMNHDSDTIYGCDGCDPGPNIWCPKTGTVVTCTLPADMQDKVNDRWFKYYILIIDFNYPYVLKTINSVAVQFVANGPPEVGNVVASQNANGTVTINYQVRDPDTADDLITDPNRGYITPSFSYWNGTSYQTISNLASGDINRQTVNLDGATWSSHSATWTQPATDFSGQFMNNTAKVQVTANDGEAFNNLGSAESATYSLDTLAPTGNAVTIDASGNSTVVHLSSTENNPGTMQVSSTDSTLASTASEPFSTSKNMTLNPGDTVYAKFTDAYQNSSGIVSGTIPNTPTMPMIQDISNVTAPAAYRFFIAWKVVAGAASYHIYRSTSATAPKPWTDIGTATGQSTNYYIDSAVAGNGNYYYYVTAYDAAGSISFKSQVVNGLADGVQDAGEGGGGVVMPPTISSVSFGTTFSTTDTITWDTDSLSNSVVQYSTSPSAFTTTVTVGSFVNNASGVGQHSVILSNLSPNQTYYFRVKSTDINNQMSIDSNNPADQNNGAGYSFTTPAGPVISDVSVVATTNTAAQIRWTTGATVASTEITYSVNSNLSMPTVTTGTSDPTAAHVVNITNLNPGTKYFFFARSVDSSGNQTLDKNVVDGQNNYYTFTTTNDIVPPAISAISVRAQPTSADIIWTTDKSADSQVQYGLTAGFGAATPLDPTLTTRHIVTLTGLAAQTKYYFVVRSRDVNGNIGSQNLDANGIALTFSTTKAGDTQAPVITNVVVSSIAPTFASVNWSTDKPADSHIEYGTSINQLNPPTGSDDLVTAHSVTMTSLTNSTTYFFRVASVDTNGNSTIDDNKSALYSFTTAPAKAPTILASNDAILMNSVIVLWTTDELADSQVEYGRDNTYGSTTTRDNAMVLNHSVTVPSLAAATDYHYRILTRDPSGNLTTGSDHIVTTSAQADHTPPLITSWAAGNIALTTATITWTTDEPATSDVEYGPNTNYAYNTANPDEYATNHTVNLAGLTPGAKYYYKIVSSDPSGNIASVDNQGGTSLTFTTLIDNTPPRISSVAAALVSNTSAVITWVTDKNSTSQVIYGTSTAYGTETAVSTDLLTGHSVTLTGLAGNTKYYYKVVSVDAYTNSATDDNSGAGHTFTTLATADVTPPKITDVKAGNISLIGATIVWTTDEVSNSFVLYGTLAADASLTAGSLTDSTTGHSVALTGLSPNVKYYFKVQSADPSGNVAIDNNNGSLYSFTTAPDVTPPAISAVVTAIVNNTSAVIDWSTDEPSTSQVVYGVDTAYGSQTVASPALATSHSVVIDGLDASTAYYYKIVSADAAGNVATDDNRGAGYAFTTTATPGQSISARISPVVDATPPAIANIKVDSVTKESAVVSWTTDKLADSIVKYGVDAKYGSLQGSLDESVTSHQVSLSNLTVGMTYHFMIVSQDVPGNKGFSTDQVFATLNENGKVPEITPAPTNTNQPTPANPPAPATAKSTDPILLTVDSLQQIVKNILNNPGDPVAPQDFSNTVNDLVNKLIHPPALVGPKPSVEVSGTQAIVRWTTDRKTSGAVAFAKDADYSAKAANPYANTVSNSGAFETDHTVTLINLEPATTYHFQVHSKGTIGGEAVSNDATFVTSSELPIITDLSLSSIVDNAATLKWKTNIPTSTSIEYLNAATGETLTQGDTALLQDHSFNLDQLVAGASYKITVVATDEAGDKAESKPIAVSTSKDTTPPVISKVSSSSTLYPGKESRVQTIITWDTDEPANSHIFYQEGLATDATVNQLPLDPAMVAHHTAVVTKFQPTTVYKFWIESADAAGNTAKSKDFLILTPQQQATILDVIIGNFEQVFGWTNKLGK